VHVSKLRLQKIQKPDAVWQPTKISQIKNFVLGSKNSTMLQPKGGASQCPMYFGPTSAKQFNLYPLESNLALAVSPTASSLILAVSLVLEFHLKAKLRSVRPSTFQL